MVPTFALDPRVQLVAGADPLPEARAVRARFWRQVYTSLEDLLAGVQVDAVYLATPVEAHLQHCKHWPMPAFMSLWKNRWP